VSDPGWLIIFDCDGVLVDSEVLSVAVDERVLAGLGVPMTQAEIIEEFVGRSHDHFVTVVEQRLGRRLPEDWEEQYEHLYRAAFEERLRPVDGIVDVLDRITWPTCVASSGSHDKIRFTLGLTGLLPRFEDRVFSVDDVARGKPEPDLFLHAATRLGHDPDRCVVVEDSPYGLAAALAAGMTAIGYAGGVNDRTRLARTGVTLIDHMHALREVIADLTGTTA